MQRGSVRTNMTYDLCNNPPVNPESGFKISMPDADVVHFPGFFCTPKADSLLEQLLEKVIWRQENIQIYGQMHKLPRLSSWYGDEGKTYTYSGITLRSLHWIDPLLEIKARIEDISGCLFNSVLLNRYRDGSDSVSWHADDERELGPCAVIGSVSFGEARSFQMKHKFCDEKCKITLEHGSYLLMKGKMQQHWLHQIPKSKRPLGERISLTFRCIY
jgi:alkylated DNA repair dioxygenase AlkB